MIKEFKPISHKIVKKLELKPVYKNDNDFNLIANMCGYTESDVLAFFYAYDVYEGGNDEEHYYIAVSKCNKYNYIWH